MNIPEQSAQKNGETTRRPLHQPGSAPTDLNSRPQNSQTGSTSETPTPKKIDLGDPNSFSYQLKQQILRAWQPVITIRSTIWVFFGISILFIVLGVVLLINTLNIVEINLRYDNKCKIGSANCLVNFSVHKTMKAPVFLYYELDNFYQNHRKYMLSKSTNQLNGENPSASDIEGDCKPVVFVKDLGFAPLTNEITLTPNSVANPCGLVPRSYFNDTFTLTNGKQPLSISKDGIAWPSDREGKFIKASDGGTQWINVEDERFLVWMRTAAFPHFRKLWGRIDQDLVVGETYTLGVENNYDVSQFSGTKTITLSTTNQFGGRNMFLSCAYLAVGGVAAIIFIIFVVKNWYFPGKLKEIESKTY